MTTGTDALVAKLRGILGNDGRPDALDALAAELHDAQVRADERRIVIQEKDAIIERVKAERDDYAHTHWSTSATEARLDKTLAALREIAPENEPWDIDQDCKFCRGHYGEHYPECAWKKARAAIAETEGEA